MKKVTLVIMAAGLGSRFGGIKQLASVGKNNETLMEFSIYDAIKAGFNKVVFVIRKDFSKEFEETILKKVEKYVECICVYQSIDNLPISYDFKNRKKPWGTGQAILVTRDVIDEPFCVINSDDYYGPTSFKKMYDFLTNDVDKDNYCMVGYLLENALSLNGGVSRGICQIDKNNHLVSIDEASNIIKNNNVISSNRGIIKNDVIASMNMWGFHPSIFDFLKEEFVLFLNNLINDDSEFLIPTVIDTLIKDEKVDVHVLKTDDKWLGITYKEDKKLVHDEINSLYDKGIYKDSLF